MTTNRTSELHSLSDRAGISVKPGTDSLEQVLEQTNLNWGVEKAQAYSPEGDEIPNLFLLRRDDTRDVLNVVKGRYQPVNNLDMFEPFDELVKAHGATYESAGVVSRGGTCWLSAKLPDSFEARAGDVVEKRMVAMANHDGMRLNSYFFFSNRVFCNNMMGSLTNTARKHGHRVKHVGDWQSNLEQATAGFAAALTDAVTFEAQAKQLVNTRMSDNQAERFIKRFIPDATPRAGEKLVTERQKSRVNRVRADIQDLFVNGAGNEGVSRWDMLNAVTEYYDHHAFRKNTQAARAFVSNAQGGHQSKNRAMTLLLAN
ncbi:DUF932 domain-containing protein [bacterium]|nr:DUF932 domain-containing protein [bacterium]